MKVTIHGSLTFKVGPMSQNQYAKVDITFTDIDPDQPIKPQVEGGRKTVVEAMPYIWNEIDEQVEARFKDA